MLPPGGWNAWAQDLYGHWPEDRSLPSGQSLLNDEAVQRLRDILRKMGIMHKLERDGIEAGNTIKIAGVGKLKY